MKWIGLTGGIASGKSTVAALLRSRGYQIIDADDLARRAVEYGSPGLKKVVQVFGPELLDSKGELDRLQLGRKIFPDLKLRKKLEEIIHPIVRELSLKERKRLEKEKHAVVFYDVPLLFEKKMEAMFDSIVVVSTREELQRERIAKRNKLSEKEITDRLGSQLPMREKVSKAHFVIVNEGTLKDLEREIENFLIVSGLPSPGITKR